MIGTLAVGGWAVTFGIARRGLLAVPNVTAHPSTASVPTSCHSMWHNNCLRTVRVNRKRQYFTKPPRGGAVA